jgi:hypothetical protein
LQGPERGYTTAVGIGTKQTLVSSRRSPYSAQHAQNERRMDPHLPSVTCLQALYLSTDEGMVHEIHLTCERTLKGLEQ